MNQTKTNHDMLPPVLDPVREITINGETIKIRELPWPQALRFSKMLFESAKQFAKDGKFDFRLEMIPDLIASAGELSNFLILETTGKDSEWLNHLSVSEGFDILDAALAINLNPEVLGKAKKAAGRFAQAMGVDAAALTRKPSPPASTS